MYIITKILVSQNYIILMHAKHTKLELRVYIVYTCAQTRPRAIFENKLKTLQLTIRPHSGLSITILNF